MFGISTSMLQKNLNNAHRHVRAFSRQAQTNSLTDTAPVTTETLSFSAILTPPFAEPFEHLSVEMSISIFPSLFSKFSKSIFNFHAMPKRSVVGRQIERPTLTRLLRICYDPFMDEMKRRKILSDVALGEVPPDTVIMNGTLFNAFTREFISNQAIWIKDGRIAYVGPDHDPARSGGTDVIDANGMVLLPGLIDAHTHLASSTSGADEFVRHVIPGGTTTVVTETMDLPFVAGKDGLTYWVKAFEGQPIRIYYTALPCAVLRSLRRPMLLVLKTSCLTFRTRIASDWVRFTGAIFFFLVRRGQGSWISLRRRSP